MKPYVICHMNSSVDGRILGSRWRPAENRMAGLFERLHEELGGGSWLIGRVTGSEYAKAAAYPDHTDQSYTREPWFPSRDAAAYGIALDARGKIAWGRSDIGGDPIVAVLTERVSDAHLAGLRQDDVSYIFAGAQELDLGLALEILNRELGLERGLSAGRPDRRDQPGDLPRHRWREGRAEHLRLQRQGGRRRGAGPLDDSGQHRGAGGRRGLAPLSAAKRLRAARNGGPP